MASLLSLDIAYVTGFAFGEVPKIMPMALELKTAPLKKPYSGEIRVVPKSSSIATAGRKHFDWLNEMLSVHNPDFVSFEAPLYTSKTAFDVARKLMGMAFVTELACSLAGIPESRVFEGNNQLIKKHFTGNARAKKPDMEQACRMRSWNVDEGHHNEADALALWDFSAHILIQKGLV